MITSSCVNLILCAILVLMLIAAVVTYHFGVQRHKNNEHAESQKVSGFPAPNPELFNKIDGIIRAEKLYTDETLQRQDILDRFDISRRTLNDILAVHANGQSFTAYINSMRIDDAVCLLREEPDMSLKEIAEKVGFTPATFRDQFKRKFGMTPTEFRQIL